MARLRWNRRTLAIALGVVLLPIGVYLVAWRVHDPRLPVTRDGVERAMASAAEYLVAHTLDDGRFVYEVDGAGTPTGTNYNVLRHAGTIHSLIMYYQRRASPRLRDTIIRAAIYLRNRHVSPVENLPNTHAVFSLPGEDGGRYRTAKLGGAGLGLLALIRARALDRSVVSIDELGRIARFILFMQREDGSFRSKYSERVKFANDFDSLYYPGEAILALVELYKVDPDPRWLDAALRAARSLVIRQRSYRRLPNDHWFMIAIAGLTTVFAQAVDPQIGFTELIDHAVALGDGMLREQRWTNLLPGSSGAFTADARSTPAATRLEGLLAIQQVLPADHPARDRLRDSTLSGIGFLLACQETAGANRGGIRLALRRRFVGNRWNQVRIDYVQHALSALIAYARISFEH